MADAFEPATPGGTQADACAEPLACISKGTGVHAGPEGNQDKLRRMGDADMMTVDGPSARDRKSLPTTSAAAAEPWLQEHGGGITMRMLPGACGCGEWLAVVVPVPRSPATNDARLMGDGCASHG